MTLAFERTAATIAGALATRAFPAAVVEIGRLGGPLWRHAAGRLTYAADAPVATHDTVFDLASLTKVLATTTIALQLTSSGLLDLEAPVRTLSADWNGSDRAEVRVRDLLEHSSGLPGYRPYYRTMSGRALYEAAIGGEPLEYQPRAQAIYSDLGFIVLGFLLERAGDATLDVLFDRWRTAASIAEPIAYRPPVEWRPRTAPTEQDPWRGRLLVGEVHDENAAALDGIAGHAGLFGTAAAVGACARWWLSVLAGNPSPAAGVDPATALAFVRKSAVPGSSRALGWDTMLPTSSCGPHLSPRAIGHTGFTGTSLWIDPQRDLYVVFLSNRVHPTRANDIQPIRRAVHTAVVEDLQELS